MAAPLVLLCGPAGCGKTTLGRQLAAALAVPFADADDLHPPANLARMRQGLPLGDAERAPWLDAVHAALRAAAAGGAGLVMACSALRQAYRDRLAQGLPQLQVVALGADRATLAQRLAARPGHFFPPHLLDSQLATWEAPVDRPVVDTAGPPAAVLAAVLRQLGR